MSMAVLELDESSRAVRDAAKGWAAGAVSTSDYRAIRRATLSAMLGLDPDLDETIAGEEDDEHDRTETVTPEQLAATQRPEAPNRLPMIIGGSVVLLLAVLAFVLLS